MDTLLLIIVALAELAFIVYLLITHAKKKVEQRKEFTFLLGISHPSVITVEDFLSSDRIKQTPFSIMEYLEKQIEVAYDRIIVNRQLFKFGELILDIDKLTEDNKKELLLSQLKASVHRVSPVKLAEIMVSYISSLQVGWDSGLVIEKGRELILWSITKDGNASNRVKIFQENLSKGVDALLTLRTDLNDNLKIIIKAELIKIQETLKA